MRKLNRLIAAGALAVPMALGASGIAGAAVGSLGVQDLGEIQGRDEGDSGDQGAEFREEGQKLRENGQKLREDLRGGDDPSTEGDSGEDSDEELLRVIEDILEALGESSDDGSGSNPTPLS